MNKIEKTALKAAQTSAKKLKKIYENFNRSDIKMKSAHEIVSYADLLSEKIIIKEIKKEFPDHHILSEEKGDDQKKSDYTWIIDPIDGTTNFTIKNPLWAISIGVLYKNELIFGLVYAPILNEVYRASKNKGAFLNNKKINVSKVKNTKVINTFCHGSNIRSIKKAVKYYTQQKLKNFDC